MRKLNLPQQFMQHARDLLSATEKGKSLHRTGNVKASGAQLENGFRSLLTNSLPSTNRVASGYFYDAASLCSAEVDILVYEDQEAFRLDPAPQDQHYIPYTSVSIIGQMKNSASQLIGSNGALSQIKKSRDAWRAMQTNANVLGTTRGQPYQHQPLTFVLCGTSTETDINKLTSTLKNKADSLPDYLLILDRGIIVTGYCDLITYDQSRIDFLDYHNANCRYLCKPEGGADEISGRALMWFYFALVSKLSLDRGNNLRYHQFCQSVSHLYPLRPYSKLV